MAGKGLERNKLDYILTDLLPVEVSELFSFSHFYSFLLEEHAQKKIDALVSNVKSAKSISPGLMFQGSWCTKPLKYKILKGSNSTREMSVVQPLAALNLFLFMECYQNDILNYFQKNHHFSIRYHKKTGDLYFRSKSDNITNYFQKSLSKLGQSVIQQSGNYFNVGPFESINSFADSRIWRMCNFKYKYYAKLDYKSCFDSIYTHAFSWIVERNTVDAKNAENSNLFVVIDRVLQNINGRFSNGVVVGPEFSRMIAEILLEHIDKQIFYSLAKENIVQEKDYSAFRYVDDIFLFANEPHILDKIVDSYRTIGERYLLRLNELKMSKGTTPCLPKEWLEKTRHIADIMSDFFYHYTKTEYSELTEENRYIVKKNFIHTDRIKDEIAVLVKTYSDDKRAIVSFLLSTLLNNFSKKKNGYRLFSENQLGKAMLLLDISLYIYAFYPSFEQTRKIISIISYMNSEFAFLTDPKSKERLSDTVQRYAFIFQYGNLFDLCDWFPFLLEYKISLGTQIEKSIIDKAEELNNPIIWANILLYSQYDPAFFEEIKEKVETIANRQIQQMSEIEPMMQIEFWYILIFHNCPHIRPQLRNNMDTIITNIKSQTTKKMVNPSLPYVPENATLLVCDFLLRKSSAGNKPLNSFFNWGNFSNFSDEITYRTYQRTLFKHYKRGLQGLISSLD